MTIVNTVLHYTEDDDVCEIFVKFVKYLKYLLISEVLFLFKPCSTVTFSKFPITKSSYA